MDAKMNKSLLKRAYSTCAPNCLTAISQLSFRLFDMSGDPSSQHQLGQRLRTASGAATVISILRQNPNDYQLLNALANLTADPECWIYLRAAGVVDLFVDFILKTSDRSRHESDVCLCSRVSFNIY